MKRLHLGTSPDMKGWDNGMTAKGIAKNWDTVFVEGVLEKETYESLPKYLTAIKSCLNPGGMLSLSYIEIRGATTVFREGKMGVQDWYSKVMLNVDKDGIPQNRSMYDQETLFNLLMNAGFIGITPADMVTHPWLHKRAVFLGGFNCYRPLEDK